MEEGYPFSGSGNLASFCRGLMKVGIQNKIIIVFDNDAEGVTKEVRTSETSASGKLATPSPSQICQSFARSKEPEHRGSRLMTLTAELPLSRHISTSPGTAADRRLWYLQTR